MRGARKKTRPRHATDRQYLHVTPCAQLCPHKNMTLIFIGLQNTIYYLIKCTVRTKDGSCNCVLYYYILYVYAIVILPMMSRPQLRVQTSRQAVCASYTYWAGQQKHIYIYMRVQIDIIGQTNATCSDQQGKHNKTVIIMTNRHKHTQSHRLVIANSRKVKICKTSE